MKSSIIKLVAIASITVLMVVIAGWPDKKPPVSLADLAGTAEADARAVRTCAKVLLAQDVAAGRCTLWEAAALFGALNRLPPEPEKSVIELPPSVPAAEQLCREVIVLVAILLAEQPAKRAATIAELEAKLNQARNQPDGVRLSEPSAELIGELLSHARNRLELPLTP